MTRRVRLWIVGLVVALVAAACGIPIDSQPEVIASEDLPSVLQPGTSTTTTLPPQLTEDVTIYLVDPGDGQPLLRAVIRQVPVVDSGADLEFLILGQLLEGPTSEEQLDQNLSTRVIPMGDEPITLLAKSTPGEGQLVITLSEAPAIEGEDRAVAFAQIVFTLTEIEGIDSIRFLVRDEDGIGQDIPVNTEEGVVTRAVERDDYSTLRPTGFEN